MPLSLQFNRSFAVWTLILLASVSADWQYKSRPDLAPPKLNITKSATTDVSPGFIFVAPYSWYSWDYKVAHGPLQPAPYIFTDAGELVWSGFGHVSGWSGNFQAAKYKGEDILFAFEGSRNALHGHSHGHVKLLDKHYETFKDVRWSGPGLLDLHEFRIVDERIALVESYYPVPRDLTEYGLDADSQWIVDARFQAIDIETGSKLFEWRSLNHVTPNETALPIPSVPVGSGRNSSDAIDYFHINSVDRNSDGDYLVSARNTFTIYKINGTSGEIIWRLGGLLSNFTLGSDVHFAAQHHARFQSKVENGHVEIISLFDNGESGQSHGKIISVNTKDWTATLQQSFPAPFDLFAFSQGNTQILNNGNAFVNWGSAGAITEFSSNASVLFHAFLDSGNLWEDGDVQNYRGFKFIWAGSPNEKPAVVPLVDGDSTVIYVSWNGDTETKTWNFYGQGPNRGRVLLGHKKRTGFETSFHVKGDSDWTGFFTEAIGADEKVLMTSELVEAEKYISPHAEKDVGFTKSSQAILGM